MHAQILIEAEVFMHRGDSHETTKSNHKTHHFNYGCDRAGMRAPFATTCQRANWRRERSVCVLHISRNRPRTDRSP